MRIAMVTSYFPTRERPNEGHSAYQMVRELGKMAEVEVFCPVLEYLPWLRPKSFPFRTTDPSYSPPDIRTHYLPYLALPLISRPFNGPQAFRAVLPRVRAYRPDLILNYWIYPDGYAAVRTASKLGLPAVIRALGSDLNRIPDASTRWLTKYSLRNATYVMTASAHLREQAIALGAAAARVRSIPNGCDSSVFSPGDRNQARLELGLPLDAQLILFVGWINHTKGVRELLDAFIQLAGRNQNARLAFVGSGAMKSELENKAAAHGVLERIRFAGNCASSQVAKWMAAANLFCLPSYAEGCPNAVLEALSCGRPVIASNVGGIPDLVDDSCGILGPPGDASILESMLERGLNKAWDEASICARNKRGWRDVAKEVYDLCLEAREIHGVRYPAGSLGHSVSRV